MKINPRYLELGKKILVPDIESGAHRIRLVIFFTILLPKVYFIHNESRWFSTMYIVGSWIVADLLDRVIYKRYKTQIDNYYSRPLRIRKKRRG